MRNKNLVFSLICGFLSGVFVLGIIFNPTISEFEKMPILLLIKRFWWTLLIFLPISFTLAILIGALFVKKIPIFFQFIKFVEIGVLNTFLDLGILNYLVGITGVTKGGLILVFNTISFLCAVSNSYFWNKTWTFERERKFQKKEFSLFVIVSAVGLLLNNAIVFFGIKFVKIFLISGGALLNLVKIFATLVAMIWNFFGYKIFVFK